MEAFATPPWSRRIARAVFGSTLVLAAVIQFAEALAAPAQSSHWVAAWAASAQGPYPVGNPSAQPELKFAFPDAARGAVDQSFRLIVKPDIWGKQTRIRLSNAFGAQPVTFDDVYVGLQTSGSAILGGTNRPITFAGKKSVTIAPGKDVVSDAVSLPFVKNPADPMLTGRRLAVSFHVAGESGPMTWHAKALTTSYVTAPGAGAHGGDEGESAFPMSTASWYFLDAVEMTAPRATREAKRKEYNQFIRSAGIFDGVIDFDVVTLDPATGELKAVYQPNSTVGGPGDKLHPNRAGYAAMGNAIDIQMVVGK